MFVRFFVGIFFLIFLPEMGLATSAQGNWKTTVVDGFEKLWTESRSGARFAIWCNPNRIRAGTVIDVDIAGRNAPPRKLVKVVIDNKVVSMGADEHGNIRTGCETCADAYRVVWNRLQTGASLEVLFDDDRYAAFSLVGARQLLAERECTPDYYKWHTWPKAINVNLPAPSPQR